MAKLEVAMRRKAAVIAGVLMLKDCLDIETIEFKAINPCPDIRPDIRYTERETFKARDIKRHGNKGFRPR